MALSDYLTGDEWDACFYACAGQNSAPNFGLSMLKTIAQLLAKGYRFSGLDEFGDKYRQVGDGINGPKCCIFLGNPHHCDVRAIIDNGRTFLKRHCPELVDETDETWAEQQALARNAQRAPTDPVPEVRLFVCDGSPLRCQECVEPNKFQCLRITSQT